MMSESSADLSAANAEAVIPRIQKLGWGVGSFASNGLNIGVFALYIQIYNIGLGVPAVWLGWALAIPRLTDALVDSWVGNLSDNTRSRWGRRRPYIFLGATLSALAFAALWLPPLGWDKAGLFYYFFAVTVVFFIGYAFFSISYVALGLELSSNTIERTRLLGVGMIFAYGYGLISPGIYKGCLLLGAWLQNHHHAGAEVPPEIIGIRYIGVAMALLILVAGWCPAIFCRERLEAQRQPKVKFFHALRLTLGNRPFVRLCSLFFLMMMGIYILFVVGAYLTLYYVCLGSKNLAADLVLWSGVFGALYAMMVTPSVYKISARTGKKPLLLLGIAALLGCYLASWVFLVPGRPWISTLTLPISIFGNICVNILCPAMMADICDFDEMESGLRREGLFSAVYSMSFKASVALASLLSGYLLVLAGAVDGVAPSAHAILIMRLLYVGIPAALLGAAFYLAWGYPITEPMVREIRRRLNARHGGHQDEKLS